MIGRMISMNNGSCDIHVINQMVTEWFENNAILGQTGNHV